MRETFKYALILGLICFLSSSVLAVINSVTEPIIKAQKEELAEEKKEATAAGEESEEGNAKAKEKKSKK